MAAIGAESSIKIGALLYTALDLSVNDDAVSDAKKILDQKGGFFSNFRGALQALILLRMTLSKDPKAYIDTIIDTYQKLETGSSVSGLFTVLSAVIITEQHGEQDLESVIGQVLELFENIKREHPDQNNESELAYAALMLLSGKADVGLEEEKEKIYSSLKEKLQIPDDAARATALVLMTNSKSAGRKVEEFTAFYRKLQEKQHAAGTKRYMSIYGAFADLTYLEELGIPESETIATIGEVDDYLKRKPGYGMFSISKDIRRVLAAALTLQHYTIEIPKEKKADFAPEISLELLLFIVLLSLVATN